MSHEGAEWLHPYLTGQTWVKDKVSIDLQPYYFSYSGLYCKNGTSSPGGSGAAGDVPYYTATDTCGTLDDEGMIVGYATRLQNLIREVTAGGEQATIVAHSQGGLITSYLIGRLQQSDDHADLDFVRQRIASVATFDSFPKGLLDYQVEFAAKNYFSLSSLSGCNYLSPAFRDWKDTGTNPVTEAAQLAARGAKIRPINDYQVPFYTIAGDSPLPDFSIGAYAEDRTHISNETLHATAHGSHTSIWSRSQKLTQEFVGCAVILAKSCNTLTLSALSGTITASLAADSGPYAPGTRVTLTASTHIAGMIFTGWTIDGLEYGTANPFTVVMNTSRSVTATFAYPTPVPQPPPVPQLNVPPPPASEGTVTASRDGNRATLTATPASGKLFLGWQVVRSPLFHALVAAPVDTWANPLTLDLSTDTTITPVFAPRPSFPDVTPQTTGAVEPIAQLAARGVIRGYEDGTFGPADPTLRSQMAALIVRAMGWGGEAATNPFADRDGVDDELWQAVAILAQHGVAKGYGDGRYGTSGYVLNAKGYGDGRYGTSGYVLNAQVVSFVTRAMVNQGHWQFQPDDGTIYPNIPASSGHRQDLVTYVHYAGAARGTGSANGNFDGWDQPSSRAWFAFALWQALDSYFGH